LVAPLSPAVIFDVVLTVTAVVVTAKVAEVLPAAIVTVAGAVAVESELAKVITRPPTGAALPICTVPVEVFPPTTEAGLKVTDVNNGAVIVNVPVDDTLSNVPIMSAVVWDPTASVLTAKVTDVAPAGTLTESGILIAALALVSVTVMPPVPAGPVKVTLPTEEPPPRTVLGATVTVDRLGGNTVKDAVWVELPTAAVNVAVDTADTAVVRTTKVADTLPLRTSTSAGSVTLFRLLVSLTRAP